jgi:hypothetical protein
VKRWLAVILPVSSFFLVFALCLACCKCRQGFMRVSAAR